ncbi:XRCC4-like factor-domain-containing protein [Neohortaea acidophila]|uniref:Non-homologous end-joining factor 1 n=1 Tax=Neohortaea acidophila TaxID=245834 RepID=A0A6A6PMK7_9PEZI|nr:XRCC4-like factor-domain-containing protein [Neohortaea acidophila]KAF2481289.1 XRCC4-like factor-domain-containing protein [Neohortaea acidophila]
MSHAAVSWRTLTLDNTHIPRLLVKRRFARDGYDVQVTDLSRVWAEALSRDDIVQRATERGSSIDPGEDDEQLDIFLRKIQSALEHEDGTLLDISSAKDGTVLQLNVQAPLPHPFPPFKWTLDLERQPDHHIEHELVTPLILQATHLRQQVQQLIHEIHDKDRVISKICDRLETSGNDLTTVFPGVSNVKTSRKKSQREQLGHHVKGLNDFDESAWRQQSDSANVGEQPDEETLDDIFRHLPSGALRGEVSSSGEWWSSLNARPPRQSLSRSTKRASTNTEHRPLSTRATNNVVDALENGEFQRQGTPPHLKQPALKPTSISPDRNVKAKNDAPVNDSRDAHSDGSTTDEEADLDAPPPKSRSAQRADATERRTAASASPKRLGAIGGRLPRTVSPKPEDTTQPDDTPAPKTRGKLGTIGGKTSQALSVASPPRASSSKPVTHEPSPAKPSKLGAIGGRKTEKATSSSRHATEEAAEPEAPTPARLARKAEQQSPPAVRETSEERADRKRDQLKRELEEKAKAPSKKKRRF